MVKSAVVLRPIVPDDGEALVQLALSSPDTGQIQVSAVYHVDPYQIALAENPETVGIVATLQESGKVVGSSFVSFSRRMYDGELRDIAWLHSLQVHPDFRRQGIATSLAAWRVDCARERMGEEVIIGASIQKGNVGSFAVANTWCRSEAGEIRAGVIGMRRRPPREIEGIRIRPAEKAEHEDIARNLNEFYGGYNFYTPQTADSLSEWLGNTPFTHPIRTYLVAEGKSGEPVAGMAVVEDHQLMEMQVQHLSTPLRLLNTLVRLVPADGRMRQLSALKAWFAPGELPALRYLWETIRWDWRDRGDTISFGLDPRSPLRDVFRTPPWIPTTSLTYVVSVPEPTSASEPRMIYAG